MVISSVNAIIKKFPLTITIICFSSLLLLFASTGYGEGKTPRFELGEIVVTATGEKDPVRKIPRNVTVITSYDIEQAPSNNVVDLLAREANVTLRSFFGHDKKGGIDIRGMGDTFVSNVLVLVDGVRLNSPDLAGPDLSSVPLDQIERIEILRGAGSVLYGGGAVGGVVNIITKKGQKVPELRLYSSYGSYETFDGRASYGGTFSNLSFNLNTDYYSSDGYRDNGYLRKKDAGLQLGYDLGKHISLNLKASKHKDRYGLPGTVPKEDVDSKKRRKKTDHPEDFSDTSDERYFAGAEVKLGRWGSIETNVGYRHRNNPFLIGYTPLQSKKSQIDSIDENTNHQEINYNSKYRFGEHVHRLQWGIRRFETDYIREDTSTQKKIGEIESNAWFLRNEWSFPSNLILSAGYRKDRSEVVYRKDIYDDFFSPNPPFNFLYSAWVTEEETKNIWKNNAFDLGVTYLLGKDTSFFASYSKSFRNPNVDELAESDNDLKPQKGRHFDFGARHSLGQTMEFSATVFQIKIEDEIYYGEEPGSGTSINRNYDERTVRQGVETDIKIYPADSLYIWGNYAYVEAKFEERDTYVPLVPKHKATIGVEWRVVDSFLISMTGTHVGSRFDGNDENNNRYEKIESYEVVDSKVSYEYKGFKLFAGVNNIFNELYATVGYSEAYYPMPTRNYYCGLEWKF